MQRMFSFFLLLSLAPSASANNNPPYDDTMPTKETCSLLSYYQVLLSSPRLLSPLSTGRATTRRPTLDWASCADARLEICADRSCSVVLQSVDVDGTEWTPEADLTGNGDVYYWRVRNRISGELGSWSKVWQVRLPATSAGFSSWGGSVLDHDLDDDAAIAVGAYDAEPVPGKASGAVYIYHLSGPKPGIPVETLSQTDPEDGSLFGSAVADAGDLNGDGFADLVVGANNATDENAVATGAAYVFYGSANGFDTEPRAVFGSEVSGFGFSVSGAGDVDGDGMGDLLVGAPAFGGQAGAAYLYRGHSGTTPKLGSPAEILFGTGDPGAEFGANVAGVGDLNGDGFSDIAVGETYVQFWTLAVPAGKVFVWYGTADGLKAGPVLTSPDMTDSDGFGFSISDATDVDHDGYFDLVVGASGTKSGQGAVYVWYGGPNGVTAGAPDQELLPQGSIKGYFGHAVSGAGDLDGDGVDDLVVGETDADGYAGQINTFLSSAAGSTVTANPDPNGAAYFGGELILTGDADGDGLSEIVVGADGAGWLFPSTGTAPVTSDGIELGPVTKGFGQVGR